MGKQLRGDEHITFEGMPTGYLITDFWRWSSSDLLTNTLRGTYAEFIVAMALGADITEGRVEWADFDLSFPLEWDDGEEHRTTVRVEVKSSSYLQAWEQSKPSVISFDIKRTTGWSPETGYSPDLDRRSDVYVFCLYTIADRSKADLLNLDGWQFYVASTKRINAICGTQKRISLSALSKLDPIKTDYVGLSAAVETCLKTGGST